MTDTRTTVTVHPSPEYGGPTVTYTNDSTEVDAQGNLVVYTEGIPGAGGAVWAAGTWARVDHARGIRFLADKAERDERQAAADTRDRDRVEKLILGQLTDTGERAVERMREMCAQMGAPLADDTTIPPLDVEGAWRALPDDAREQSIAYGLQLYRAGRDDQEANRG